MGKVFDTIICFFGNIFYCNSLFLDKLIALTVFDRMLNFNEALEGRSEIYWMAA